MTDSPRVARRKRSAPPVPAGVELPAAQPSRLAAAMPSKDTVRDVVLFVLDVLLPPWA